MQELRDQIARINSLARGFMDSQALFAANAAGIFSLLEQPHSAEEVAVHAGWDKRATRILLEALIALGLVVKTGAKYHNSQISSTCLVPGHPGYQGNIVEHIRHTASGWFQIEKSLKTGVAAESDRGERSSDELRSFILGMQDIARFSAKEILAALNLSPYRHMLDLGGGPATYSISFLDAYPLMKATLFDMPNVIPIAKEQAQEAKMIGRMSFIPGNMLVDSYGSGYDLILLSNLIHSFSPENNATIVRKCYEALDPGGLFIIKDFITDNDRTGPAFSLMFALHMLVLTGEGDTYSFAQIQEWTRAAGFEDYRALDLTPQTRMWLVKKPFPHKKSSLIGFLDKTPASKLPHGDYSPD
jgi:SAM-dependent methyltransferase